MSKPALGSIIWSLATLVIVNFGLLVGAVAQIPGIGSSLVSTFVFLYSIPVPATGGSNPSFRTIIIELSALYVGITVVGTSAVWLLKRLSAPAKAWIDGQTLWRISLYRTMSATIAWMLGFSILSWWQGYPSWSWLAPGLHWIAEVFLLQGIVTGAAWFMPDPRDVRPVTFLAADEVARVQTYRSAVHSGPEPSSPDRSTDG